MKREAQTTGDMYAEHRGVDGGRCQKMLMDEVKLEGGC